MVAHTVRYSRSAGSTQQLLFAELVEVATYRRFRHLEQLGSLLNGDLVALTEEL
jgi:hypothetical protein